MKVNLENSPLPKYKKQKLQDLVKKIKFKSFLRDTDKLRRDAKVLPLTRFEMEAAWYQLVYRRWESKGVGVENSATETEKQRLKQNYLQMALDQVCTGGSPSNLTLLTFDGFQSRNLEVNDWWKLQKEKNPDLDIKECPPKHLPPPLSNANKIADPLR